MTDERLFEVSVAAIRLKRCPETIRRYIRAGRLRAIRTPGGAVRGGNYLIPETAIEEFLLDAHNLIRQTPS